mmetsp:Transcript_2025/g.5702  ORF Transcript_2025/g.5702 Transcript_2025/m.5702 type:complete len:84 (+) Transcript_2025:210-461(+)
MPATCHSPLPLTPRAAAERPDIGMQLGLLPRKFDGGLEWWHVHLCLVGLMAPRRADAGCKPQLSQVVQIWNTLDCWPVPCVGW